MSNGIENFFKTQVTVFDQAVQFENSLHDDLDRIAENEEAHKALNTIRLITMIQTGSKFNYNRIHELNPLMDMVRTAHDKMLEEKRAEVLETVRQCMEATHTAANGDSKASHLIEKSDRYFSQCKEKIAELKSLALLDAMFPADVPSIRMIPSAISSLFWLRLHRSRQYSRRSWEKKQLQQRRKWFVPITVRLYSRQRPYRRMRILMIM